MSTNGATDDGDPPIFADLKRAPKAAPLPEPKTTWRSCGKIVLAHHAWCPSCSAPKPKA